MSRSECNTLPTSKEFIRRGGDAFYCVGGLSDCKFCKCSRQNAMQQLISLVDSAYSGCRMSYGEFMIQIQDSIASLPEYVLCGKENLFNKDTMSLEDYCASENFKKYDTLKKYVLQYKYNKGISLDNLANALIVDTDVLYYEIYLNALRCYCKKSNIDTNAKVYRRYIASCFKEHKETKVDKDKFTQTPSVMCEVNILTDVCEKNGLEFSQSLNQGQLEELIRFVNRVLVLEKDITANYFYVKRIPIDALACCRNVTDGCVMNRLDRFITKVGRALIGYD